MAPNVPHGFDPAAMLPLKPIEFSVLVALAEQDRHGYGIVKRIAERSGGAVMLAPGNLYQVLDRLVDGGLIEERAGRQDGGSRRRYYGITGAGRQVATAEAARLKALVRTLDRLDLAPERPS
jgi:DNA-binding PadR family transcriptional regulator